MTIQPIGAISRNVVNFNGQKKNGYENPINRSTERNLAILGTAGLASLVGVTAGLLTTCFPQFKGRKIPTIVGGCAALFTMILALPSRLYNTKVNAFAKEKEMDVFSRQKAAQANIYGDINNEIKDEEVSLDDKVRHYSTVKMADNGRGVMVQGAS